MRQIRFPENWNKPLLSVCAPAVLLAACLFAVPAWAQSQGDACPRPSPGSVVQPPPELRSQNGRLEVTLNFRIAANAQGLARFCYVSDRAQQAPTLRLYPGDELVIHFHNDLPGNPPAPAAHAMAHDSHRCAGDRMSLAATNVHFHGLSVPPTCHQDDVMQTLIEPSTTFDYRFKIPAGTPPGLYWYHPHPHPFSEAQVQGGASGALIVEGIAAFYPSIRGLPERVLVLRDQQQSKTTRSSPDPNLPGWDVSINYVPLLYPKYVPAVIETIPHRQEFWRVLNAAADTIFNLQVMVNNAPQPLRLLAIDGVPLSAESPSSRKTTEVFLPPGSRAEFVVTTPRVGDHAELVTRSWDTGPDGDKDPRRTLANIVSTRQSPVQLQPVPPGKTEKASNYAALKAAKPAVQRKLYFSEIHSDPKHFGLTSFFLTVEGQTPAMFKMDDPPNIVARQGTVEDWTVENRSREDHVFHIHQVHFQVLEIDGKPVQDPALRDTINVPYWNGSGPYPSVKLRMDFRDPNVVGTFMYHCHILQHADNGMMGTIEVLPAKGKSSASAHTSTVSWCRSRSTRLRAPIEPGELRHGPTYAMITLAGLVLIGGSFIARARRID